MGGAVSTGEDNDDLVDNLLEQACITSALVERVFRAVDRGLYFTEESRHSAYKDTAWRNDNLHLSAPCIYSAVLENLSLERGHSFLNIGSGTGYVSTMVGLIVGSSSVNHGVELYPDVVDYANTRLSHFQTTSTAVDMFDFCPPQFVCGNGLLLGEGRQYDRIYCGARCPTVQLPYLKQLLKVGGVLVVPVNDHLKRIERVRPDQWDVQDKLSVSFAPLIEPRTSDQRLAEPSMPLVVPSSLQQLSRARIRRVLRDLVSATRPELTSPPARSPRPSRRCRAAQESHHSEYARRIQRFVIPLLGSPDDEEGEGEEGEEQGWQQRQLRHFGEVLYGAVARMAREEWERDSQRESGDEQANEEEEEEVLMDALAPPTPPHQASSPPEQMQTPPERAPTRPERSVQEVAGESEAAMGAAADCETHPPAIELAGASQPETAATAAGGDRAGLKRTMDGTAAGTSDGQKRGRRDKFDSGVGDSDDAVPSTPPQQGAAIAEEPATGSDTESDVDSADESEDSDTTEAERAGRLPSSLVIGLPSTDASPHHLSVPRRRRQRRLTSDSETDEGCPPGERRRRRQRQPTEERARVFSEQLRQLVRQLPLPHQLRVYVNLDRPL